MTRSILTLCALLACAQGATAASSYPWQFGLRFGDALEKRLPAGGGALDTERPLGATAGYAFHKHFAVELSITDLGRSERSAAADAGFQLEGNLYTLGLVAMTEVADRFAVFGGVGAFRLMEDGTATTLAGPRRFDIDQSGFYLEGGARYRLNSVAYLRGSYQWLDFDQDSDGTPWLGVEVHF